MKTGSLGDTRTGYLQNANQKYFVSPLVHARIRNQPEQMSGGHGYKIKRTLGGREEARKNDKA
jgi:hypothetical protein